MLDYLLILFLATLITALAINVIREISALFKDVHNDKFVYGSIEHSMEHLLFFMFFFVAHIGFYIWLIGAKGLTGAIAGCILEKGMVYPLIFTNIAGLFLVYHLKKERLEK